MLLLTLLVNSLMICPTISRELTTLLLSLLSFRVLMTQFLVFKLMPVPLLQTSLSILLKKLLSLSVKLSAKSCFYSFRMECRCLRKTPLPHWLHVLKRLKKLLFLTSHKLSKCSLNSLTNLASLSISNSVDKLSRLSLSFVLLLVTNLSELLLTM